MSGAVPVTAELLRDMPLPEPKEGSKEGRGSLMVIGGSVEVPGAVLLAATAALRVGAGKLSIATVASLARHLGLHVPEALVIGVPETPTGGMARGTESLLTRVAHCDAVLIGPGMMEETGCENLVADLLGGLAGQPVVLDAEAIPQLRSIPDIAMGHRGRAVITPHAGEMAKLLGRDRDAIEADPRAAALEAAHLLQVVVVMKGSSTIIVSPTGGEWLYEGGGVGLATSGSGDVLAGLIVGLLARGAKPSQAAIWGVYLHGRAGERLAKAFGRLGFLARELAGEVPSILAEFDGKSVPSG